MISLMYPLLVACKSISNLRKVAAQEMVDKVRQHSGVLVDQAQLVSNELIRVAILWHEMWHEALEEASCLYFGEHNIEGMLKVLEPLHEVLEEGAMRNNTTIKEKAFIQELTQGWDLYYHVFRRIDKQLQTLTSLDLQFVSPELVECQNLELAVPDSQLVTIASFAPGLVVITSKLRPWKLTIHGSDGEDYAFLLKGHEDLRQDERVMQALWFGEHTSGKFQKHAEKDLSIQRYAVIPLSPNSRLIGWVPKCDTLHQLIREYRDARKIALNLEHKHMLNFVQDYDHLPLIAEVEVFEYALQNTEGNDLARVLWLKSHTSENWLDRRTNFTRSLAVMSMVGYLLGFGDRHPSNLMLHRYSGKILHIDFGDCFEASTNREKFPEKVPFRLTRMLVKAMEVSSIAGNFRSTCENVMQVLRTSKDSVMAMMEAFVHDPLINWRLFNFNEVPQISTIVDAHVPPVVNSEEIAPNGELHQPQQGARERKQLQSQLGDANGVLNERAVVVMARMSNKLTGHDFSTSSSVSTNSIHHAVDHNTLTSGDTHEVEHGLSVKLQVQKLILQLHLMKICAKIMSGIPKSSLSPPLSVSHSNSRSKSYEFNSHSIRSIRKSEEPTESLFMKELKKRGMNPTSLLEESNRSIYGDEGIKFMEEEGGSSKRNAVSTDYEKSLSNQRERSIALNSEGFEGLIPRAKLLLSIGGTFFFGFWPLILVTIASFSALYLYFGQTFVHDASIRLPITPPQYIDPYTLLEDERISQTAPRKN
ncbi:unnamed protein product [Camellia sinensis]